MGIGKDSGVAIGVLAGTTMASGCAFLMGLGSFPLMWTVSIGGGAGAIIGTAVPVLLKHRRKLREK
ncbi:hypothetical protein GRF59_09345 [Paenibacillus sp. HJL G12]|uniref:Uncharacterized protein n=1 Tax=Paenibacillus dendrobii TaxID=2691084 RepID=A0A7X3IH53_9BACL|nr:hypothetical protein [Paenibacillus dendrobii]MWV43839.1 hypothetical protein [Paenibacillus dendrobii]